jgi:hypothetical protein
VSDADLVARRLEVVREHMDAENRHDFDAVIATFDRFSLPPPRP